jgi:hypothetical protein
MEVVEVSIVGEYDHTDENENMSSRKRAREDSSSPAVVSMFSIDFMADCSSSV